MARSIEGVTLSAYMWTSPDTFRAARPMVWISDVPDRRKPSLSASRIATSDTSGRSRPSRSRLMPDQHVELAEPQLAQQLDPAQRVDLAVQVPGPDAVLEQVVGQVLGHLLGQRGHQDPLVALGPQPDLARSRSSIWPLVGLMTTCGSTSPVGRITCSTTSPPTRCSSYGPGVADR